MNERTAIPLLQVLTTALAVLLAVVFGSQTGFAINASPHEVIEHQPDGTPVRLHIRGDERFNWQEDQDGFVVVTRGGRHVYVEPGPSGEPVASALEAGKVDPRAFGLRKRHLPSAVGIIRAGAKASVSGGSGEGEGTGQQSVAAGVLKNLVIPIRFANHGGRTVPGESDLDVLFNSPTPDPVLAPTGSVRELYLVNSYGQLVVVSTIAPWVTVSNSESYYANGVSGDQTLHEALLEALQATDAVIDFSQFDQDNDGNIDAITFVHSGYGAEWGGTDADGTPYPSRIWSHKWSIWDTNGDGVYDPELDQPWESADGAGVKVWDYSINPSLWGTQGTEIGHIGVISHELGHFLGLPDLYDINGGGNGIGSYGLMANSWGFDGSQLYPSHLSPWSKMQLGWIAPTVLSTPGTYQLHNSEQQDAYYRIDHGYPSSEYLLIENRQPILFDGSMPQGGLAIWHIDETANHTDEGYPFQLTGGVPWPENGRHYRVALLQADGNYDLEFGANRGDGGDVWHFGGVGEIDGFGWPNTDVYQNGLILSSNNRISNISLSQNVMSFDYDNAALTPVLPTAPSDLSASHDEIGRVTLTWTDNAGNEDFYRVYRDGIVVGVVPAESESFIELVAEGSYQYYVEAYNGDGGANSEFFDYDVDLPNTAYADGESLIAGSVEGSYLNTVDPTDAEIFTERKAGKGGNQKTLLENQWWFYNIRQTASVRLVVNAQVPATGGDDFEFGYSSVNAEDPGWQTAFVFSNGSDEIKTAAMAPGVSGTVFVRVGDTYRSKRDGQNDSIIVRQVYIEMDDEVVLAAPTNVIANAISTSEIQLAWVDGTGETSYDVQESDGGGGWLDVATNLPADSTSHLHQNLAEGSTHTYRICGIAASGTACSSTATATTSQPDLTATGFKRKGVQHADLEWTVIGAGTVYRDGVAHFTFSGGRYSYTDNIGKKGGGTYVYQVCDASQCTNTAPVSF